MKGDLDDKCIAKRRLFQNDFLLKERLGDKRGRRMKDSGNGYRKTKRRRKEEDTGR